jgi:hypothetical protein
MLAAEGSTVQVSLGMGTEVSEVIKKYIRFHKEQVKRSEQLHLF